MTYSEIYREGVSVLKDAGIADAETDARLLFEFVFNTDRYELSAHPDKEADELLYKNYVNLIRERYQRVPLQHITGNQMFMGIDFYVNQDVLIPRQDTENLVETVLPHVHDGMKILDLCTGSGCIVISLLSYTNDTSGTGCDISEKALEVARKNAESNAKRLEGRRLDFKQGDLYEALDKSEDEKYDIIVSNPPYIRSKDIKTLEPEVKEHDPMLALDGGEDGLIFYKRILEGMPRYLKKGGRIFMEIGFDQGEDVKKLFEEAGLNEVEVIKDYSGNDRIVAGVRPILKG